MADIIRGTVKKVLDGDSFEMDVLEVVSGDADQYDTVERVRIASLDDEIVSRTDELEEGAPVDEDETTGTPEEASIETGSINPSRFFGIMSPEDLEARLGGGDVECRIRERDEQGALVAEVAVLQQSAGEKE